MTDFRLIFCIRYRYQCSVIEKSRQVLALEHISCAFLRLARVPGCKVNVTARETFDRYRYRSEWKPDPPLRSMR